MKQRFFFALFGLALLFWSCRSLQPPPVSFTAMPSMVLEGDTVTLSWVVADADSARLEGQRVPLIGRKQVVPKSGRHYTLWVYRGDSAYPFVAIVHVLARSKTVPRGTPAQEHRSTQPSVYLRGIVNAQSVKPKDQPRLEISLIDAQDRADSVILYCTVRDRYGNYVANLAPPYNDSLRPFWRSVVESIDGKPYPVTDFSVREIRQNIAPPFVTAFVLDYSGSMSGDIGFVEQAFREALRYVRPGKDAVTVVQFDHRVYHSVPPTMDLAKMQSLIPFGLLAGGTAYIDAASVGIDAVANVPKRKVIILFTDGFDNASFWHTPLDVVLKARRLNAKLFVIGFERPFGAPQRQLLEVMAAVTGGKAYFPRSIAELESIFREIYLMLQVYYRIAYPRPQVATPVRLVNVTFKFPGLDTVLSAQRSYYASAKPAQQQLQQDRWQENRSIVVAWFEYGKSTIRAQDTARLQELAAFLRQNPDKKVRIIGHTDTSGDVAVNKRLSLRRAKAVAQMLRRLGVPKRQIAEIIGKGEDEPLYPQEENEYQRQENRRVEIQIVRS